MSTTETTTSSRLPPGRLASLDGLRGLASVVVLVHHSLLTVPALAGVYFGAQPAVGSKTWLAAYTPLHLFWAGNESVYLFFVLSGVVLVLQALKSPRIRGWIAYYPRRAVRLYLPIWGAIAFAYVTFALIPRVSFHGEGAWLRISQPVYTGAAVHADMIMLQGHSGAVTPFWSLYWELLFSITLPLYVLFAAIGHRYLFWPKLAVVIGAMAYGAGGAGEYYFYLSMFGLGALFAAHWTWIGSGFARLFARNWIWWPYLVVALGLTCLKWLMIGVGYQYGAAATSASWLQVVGVAMLVLGAGFWPGMRRLFELRLFQWLGVVSFSLYLVHEPIVVGLRFLFAGQSAMFTIPVSILASFFVAAMFSRHIELPAHRLSQRVGRAILDILPKKRVVEPAPVVAETA